METLLVVTFFLLWLMAAIGSGGAIFAMFGGGFIGVVLGLILGIAIGLVVTIVVHGMWFVVLSMNNSLKTLVERTTPR